MLPPGFTLATLGNMPAVETLASSLTWEQPMIIMFGREVQVPRLTCWMGTAAYTYSGRRHEPAPMPRVVAELHATSH